jgi:branched-chain amino acid transport system substrate-binding protein
VRRSKSNRAVGALIATAVIIAGCSGDDEASPGTDAVPETTEATTETTEATLDGEGLEIGLLAPSPGLLAGLFQGQERGSAFAAADVDDAGGVLEGPLTITSYPAEPGAEPTENVQAALGGGAQALIGPAGSDAAEAVRDEVASSGSIACSASATLPRVTRDQESIALFRTALPDDVTTTYLTSAVTERRDAAAPGAAWKVAVVGRSDEYGLSISNGLAVTLAAAGMEPTVIGYHPRRVNFAGTAEQVAAAAPDFTVLVTYEEGFNLLSSLVQEGLDPAAMVGLDAFFAPRAAELATPGGDVTAVDGFTLLGSMGNKAFLDRLIQDDDNAQVSFAPQAYDCAITLALATAAVDSGGSETIADAVRDVTAGGVTCTTYADCLDKLNAGEDIDYDGVSGQLAIDENGDPTFAPVHHCGVERRCGHQRVQHRRRHRRHPAPTGGVRRRRPDHQDPTGPHLPRLLQRSDQRPRHPRVPCGARCVPDVGRSAADRHLRRGDRRSVACRARPVCRTAQCHDRRHPATDDRPRLLHRSDRRGVERRADAGDPGAPGRARRAADRCARRSHAAGDLRGGPGERCGDHHDGAGDHGTAPPTTAPPTTARPPRHRRRRHRPPRHRRRRFRRSTRPCPR